MFRIQQILKKWFRCIQVSVIIINWTSYWSTRTPTNLICAVVLIPGEHDFSWTDNSAGDVKFRIYKSADGINFFEDGTTIVGDNTYTATGIFPPDVFGWKVVGYIGTHESPPTNTLFTGI